MIPVDYLSKKYPRRGSVMATYSKTEVLQMLEEYASSQLEPQVKHANADLNLMAGMYAVLQCQLSCVWNKLSGKETLANNDAKHLIPKIELLNEELEKRLSV